jgi:PadR family transcriptional regulator, regulatory protein PadR
MKCAARREEERLLPLTLAPGLTEARPRTTMPRDDGLPPGTLVMLILRVLASQPLHGYAIGQRISLLTDNELSVEEGSLYPALQKLLLKGWVKASPTVSETGRHVREYRITPAGRKQLDLERTNYVRVSKAIGALLDNA